MYWDLGATKARSSVHRNGLPCSHIGDLLLKRNLHTRGISISRELVGKAESQAQPKPTRMCLEARISRWFLCTLNSEKNWSGTQLASLPSYCSLASLSIWHQLKTFGNLLAFWLKRKCGTSTKRWKHILSWTNKPVVMITHAVLTNYSDLNSFSAIHCIGRKGETQWFLCSLQLVVRQVQQGGLWIKFFYSFSLSKQKPYN